MHNIWYFIGLISLSINATEIYIKNWSTSPVIIEELSKVKPNEKVVEETNIPIDPGQSLQLKHNKDINFDQIKITFVANNYEQTENIFFPDEAHEKATLSFANSGYTRFPYNAINKK